MKKKRLSLLKYGYALIALLCVFSIVPQEVFSQSGGVSLQTRSVNPSPNGNFNWQIKINSPIVTGTAQVTIKVYEQVSLPQTAPLVNQQNVSVTAVGGIYNSGSILLPNKTYVAEGVYTINGVQQTTQSITTTTGVASSSGNVGSEIVGNTNPVILEPSNPSVTPSTPGEGETYELLAPLPIFGKVFNASGKSFGDYLSIMFTFFVSFAGVLAVVMLIFGGIQYMSTDSLSGTEYSR